MTTHSFVEIVKIRAHFLICRPCSDLVPGHGRQSEHSLLLAPEHKFGHRVRARALAPQVVLGHLARARAIV